jgi:hypothetical protein
MRKHESLARADKVLAKVKRILGRDYGGERVTVECWSNGREQGYAIQMLPRPVSPDTAAMVVFAMHRTTEATVVVTGRLSEFDDATHQPKDDAWDRSMVLFGEIDEAARHVADFVRSTVEGAAVAHALMKRR